MGKRCKFDVAQIQYESKKWEAVLLSIFNISMRPY